MTMTCMRRLVNDEGRQSWMERRCGKGKEGVPLACMWYRLKRQLGCRQSLTDVDIDTKWLQMGW